MLKNNTNALIKDFNKRFIQSLPSCIDVDKTRHMNTSLKDLMISTCDIASRIGKLIYNDFTIEERGLYATYNIRLGLSDILITPNHTITLIQKNIVTAILDNCDYIEQIKFYAYELGIDIKKIDIPERFYEFRAAVLMISSCFNFMQPLNDAGFDIKMGIHKDIGQCEYIDLDAYEAGAKLWLKTTIYNHTSNKQIVNRSILDVLSVLYKVVNSNLEDLKEY